MRLILQNSGDLNVPVKELLSRLLHWDKHPHQDCVDAAVERQEDRELLEMERERIQRMEDEIAVMMREHDENS